MENNIIEIAKKINNQGGRLYLVGGAARDKIIGIKSQDEDYCVTGLTAEEFKKIFPESFARGKAFEVFDIEGKEFALARTEQKIGVGHKNFEITTGKNITIIEDLKRRDLTINSIAEDVLSGEIIDPFEGRLDIKNHIIRATSNAFLEDPLRAYRAARFACKFDFEIEEKTIELMNKSKTELNELSSERVFDEMRKALSYDKPSIFFNMLKRADILDVHFVELFNLIGVLQPGKYHPEGDAYNHTMLALDKCATLTDDVKIRFAALVHDLGKGLTPVSEYPHHYTHDIDGEKLVNDFCLRLKMPNEWCAYGKVSAKEHMKGGIFNKMTPKKQVQFIERVYKTRLGLKGLEIVVESDRNCRGDKIEKIEFAKLGIELMSTINGEYIINTIGNVSGEQMKLLLYEQRIKWLKEHKNN